VTEAVLDASALLAFLRNEPGAARVGPMLGGSRLSTVNLAEVLGKLASYGKPAEAAAYQIERLHIQLVPFDAEQAKLAASLWPATRAAGLSLGDRACLALGLKTGLPVVTADRQWDRCGVGVTVIQIR
jgi:PIN domain nuclease of toxin-antitoxin system